MDRDTAISKIKKCMALGKSANPHEAAAAMRQAQKLMAEHGLSAADAELTDVATSQRPGCMKTSQRWESALAQMIAGAFACDYIWCRDQRLVGWKLTTVRSVIFVGIGNNAELAGYAWDVLARQLVRQRLEHIRKQPGSCKPITKTARGDAFAEGWVVGVSDKVQRFAGTEHEQLLIGQFMTAKWPDATRSQAKDRTKGRNVSMNHRREGFRAGEQASLNKAVGAVDGQLLLS